MRTNNWAIQISRSIFDSEIWLKPSDWLKIWVYVLGRVNFEDNNLYKRWENLFNYRIIALECWVKYKSVENCMKFLKDRKQIEVQKTTRGVNLKVINYDEYQNLSNYTGNRKGIDRKQKGNRQGTITEELKNERTKELNNNILSKDNKELALKKREDIDLLIQTLKTEADRLWIAYDKTQERNFGKHICTAKEYWSFCEKIWQDRIEFAKNIMIASAKINFWKGACSWPKTIYQNYSDVYNKFKGKQPTKIINII